MARKKSNIQGNRFHHLPSITLSFLVLLLLATPTYAQEDDQVAVYKNNQIVSKHKRSAIDSISFNTIDHVQNLLIWQSGSYTSHLLTEVDSIRILPWEEEPQPPQEPKTIVFVEGVSMDSGWYDVNKVGKGENGDINMCWAAATANMIEWWQDRYISKGGVLPEGAIKGPGETYELALMELFHQQWNNEKGGHVVEAVPWYFEGVNYGEHASPGSQAYPLPGNEGGFYKSVWTDIYPHLYHEYSYMFDWYQNLYAGDFNNYYIWGNGTSLKGKERLKVFTDLVVEFIDRGIAALTISLAADLRTLHHSTTIWGYEIDNTTGLLTRLWITDSDDLEKEPKAPLLNEYQVSIGEGNAHVKLTSSSVRYGSCYAVSLNPVSGYKTHQK
jgi:hypothetical protein